MSPDDASDRTKPDPTSALPALVEPEPEPPAPVQRIVDHGEEFDWSHSESVVIQDQPKTACYWNPFGQLVVRQQSWPDDDSWIYFNSESAGALVLALVNELADSGEQGVSAPILRRAAKRLIAAADRIELAKDAAEYEGMEAGR